MGILSHSPDLANSKKLCLAGKMIVKILELAAQNANTLQTTQFAHCLACGNTFIIVLTSFIHIQRVEKIQPFISLTTVKICDIALVGLFYQLCVFWLKFGGYCTDCS